MKQTYKEWLTERFNQKSYHLFTKDTYRLAAISGDVSARGMGNVARIIKVDKEDFERVNRYIEIQSEINEIMISYGYRAVWNNELPDDMKENLAWLEELRKEAMDTVSDYFTSKYDFRSKWAWLETPDVDYDKYHQDQELMEETA